MRIAVMPFATSETADGPLARQFAGWAAHAAAVDSPSEIEAANMMVSRPDQPGGFATLANPPLDGEIEPMVKHVADVRGADIVVTGELHREGQDFAVKAQAWTVPPQAINFSGTLREVLKETAAFIADVGGGQLGYEVVSKTATDEILENFLVGRDCLMALQEVQALDLANLDVAEPLRRLLSAAEEAKDWKEAGLTAVQLIIAATQRQAGQPPALLAGLDRAKELGAEGPIVPWARAQLLVALGQLGPALEATQQTVEQEPEAALAWLLQAQMQLQLNMPANAEQSLRKGIEHSQDPPIPLGDLLTEVLVGTGRAHEAPAMWEEIAKKWEGVPIAGVRWAQSLASTGQDERAEAILVELEEQNPEDAGLKDLLAAAAFKRQDLNTAMDKLEEAIELAPMETQFHVNYIQVLEQAERPQDLPDALRALLASEPDSNIAAQAQAKLIELTEPKRAQSVAEAMEKADGGDPESALRDLKPLAPWLADYWKYWLAVGTLHNRLGQFVEAEAACRDLLDKFPACEPAYGELAAALFSQEQGEAAYEMLQHAQQNMPQSVSLAVNLGLAAARTGRKEEAKALAQQLRAAIQPDEDLEAILQQMEA
jgi:tetratricopeptide (TPR) repeat protein